VLYKLKAIIINLRNRHIMALLALSLITVVVFFIYFYPSWKYIAETKGEIVRLEESLEESRLSKGQEISQKEIKELEKNLLKMKSIIPGEDVLQDLFVELEKLFFSHSFEKHTLRISEISSYGDNSYNYLDIAITLLGSEQEIIDYIRDIESHSRALEIRQVNLDRRESLFFGTLYVRVLINY